MELWLGQIHDLDLRQPQTNRLRRQWQAITQRRQCGQHTCGIQHLVGTAQCRIGQRRVAAATALPVPLLLVGIPLAGLLRKVNVYEVFIEGAKEGFEIGVCHLSSKEDALNSMSVSGGDAVLALHLAEQIIGICGYGDHAASDVHDSMRDDDGWPSSADRPA